MRSGARQRRTALYTPLLRIHDQLSISVTIFWALVGLWGLVAAVRGGRLSGSIAGALVIGEILIVVQVLAGLALVFLGGRPPEPAHYLYGATGVLVLPFAWSFFRERDQRQALVVYSLLALFIAGLAIRGITTGTA